MLPSYGFGVTVCYKQDGSNRLKLGQACTESGIERFAADKDALIYGVIKKPAVVNSFLNLGSRCSVE